MGAMPIVAQTDREAIRLALDYLIGPVEPQKARVIRIRDTLNLEQMQVSEPVAEELRSNPAITFCDPPREMGFDEIGNMATVVVKE
jgi:hypothetical protein